MSPGAAATTAAALVFGLAGGPAGAGEPPRVVPVHEEPYHRLVFEHPQVRVFSTSIPAGDRSLFHRHENPTLYVLLNRVQMRSQDLGADWVVLGPGPARSTRAGAAVFRNYRQAPQVHRVENPGSESFQLIGTVNYTGGVPTEGETSAGLEVHNRWFAVRRHRLAAGESSHPHRHAHPTLLVQATDGRSQVREAGRPQAFKTVAGNWSWHLPGPAHRLVNTGDSPLVLIEVEVRLAEP